MNKNIHKVISAFLMAIMFSAAVLDMQQAELSNKLIRIHVVANSNSIEDQRVKLEIKDEILYYLQPKLKNAANKKEANSIVEDELQNIKNIAKNTLSQYESGNITCTLEKERFPTRGYDTFSLPAGQYTSLRVKIGEGKGENWWCVVYPNVCYAAAEDDLTELGLSKEEESLIKSKDGYVIKFRLIEIIGKIKAFFK